MLLHEILNANLQYQEKASEVKALYKELCQLNDQLDLDEVKQTMSYEEAKQLFELVKYATNDSTKVNALKALVQAKKEEKYPEILGVHYYPVIKNFHQLSHEEQLKLDRKLKELYSPTPYKRFTMSLPEEVVQSLLDLNILTRQYLIRCDCHCHSQILSEEMYLRYLDYWKRESLGETISEEEIEALDEGYLSIYCEETDTDIEIFNPERLNRYSHPYLYVSQAPDLSLEEL